MNVKFILRHYDDQQLKPQAPNGEDADSIIGHFRPASWR